MERAELLKKKEAIEFLGLDEKVFENYFRSAGEIKCQERKNRKGFYYFNKNELDKWLKDYQWRTIDLTKEDYALCLDFALAQHLRGYVLSDWGTARQREFGQKITNWVKGQLGEVAVRRFFKEKFGVDVKLDFDIHEEIVPQDIIGVVENGKKRKPKIGVAIKSSKPKSAYLILSKNEVTLAERRSAIYILCRPDIPDDHLLRIGKDPIIQLVRNKPHFSSYKDQIPSFKDIPCEVVGYCSLEELEKVKSIPGQEFDSFRYVKQSGALHRTRKDWEALLAKL
jgi:hypothetical protein